MPLPKPYSEIVEKIINDNIDLRTKVIGDRVLIWDFSSVTDMQDHKLCRFDFQDIKHLIVIETGKRVELQIFNTTYIQDLVVVNPKTKIMYRTASAHVKILDRVKMKVKKIRRKTV